MKIFNTALGPCIEHNGNYFTVKNYDFDTLVNQPSLYDFLETMISELTPAENFELEAHLLPPIVSQEIWASGVTYLRSKTARMEESKDAGGGDFYDRVYSAERPEIFFKATAARTVGHKENIKIRRDSKWNVPEPELTLFVNSSGEIAGYTIGNDVSSRDIEGENPLYLPQAKSYDKSAAIGPGILVLKEPISRETEILLEIERAGEIIFSQSTRLTQMKREFPELVKYLTFDCTFKFGCFLMTGTGIVPPDSFSLVKADTVHISIEGIGKLSNTVE
ncbi:2-hydroxyhepta-2,4-diene-1,7-dioate isomerase [Emticicia aquatilis]|uniref:2-hydroxyhepta-2,4-diene-1,7-dioate isomerase n=1 Tax=Emticicia aquatilis TaxID=1537369 RepID=A0A917DNS8_9BACT|nr:fumarylacetoacetate hydrolase family protein [Emticicia aquatilis]GGD52223.1 2-hydroxyhepta-2,4-diene-1,7-dioate isomerase [Emticicia aquatilis]